ncbi:PIHD2 protein, partial [Rhynochetos jubatus]|nr:PIHD2 protein [Rhynochetos jubatus]
ATAAPMEDAALAEAAQLWSLLDEMAENDPQAYRRFLRQQRDEAEQLCAPPEPRLCLRARPAVGARGAGLDLPPWERGGVGRPLFINVCGWKRVPAPKAPGDPTPVYLHSVVDIAYNPDVLQRGEENPEEMEHLIRLTLKFVEERYNLILSYSHTVESFKLKGSLETMQQRLKGRQAPAPRLGQPSTKELTLAELLRSLEGEGCSSAPVLPKASTTRSKARLIEEISGTDLSETLRNPLYEMITVKDANKKPLQIELRIELPEVSSVSECDLRISKDDLIIEVPEKYKLQLNLPELVDEETTTAVFNTGKRVLLVTLPVAEPDP